MIKLSTRGIGLPLILPLPGSLPLPAGGERAGVKGAAADPGNAK
jgi:hypothetical protein